MKLCYKDYSVKMSLGAIKKFKQATNLDLGTVLLQFIDNYSEGSDPKNNYSIYKRMSMLSNVCGFEVASQAFHALLEDKHIPLDEIQDGMFRVGYLPTERDGDWSEPWPLVMVFLAFEVNKQFADMPLNLKKKAATEE